VSGSSEPWRCKLEYVAKTTRVVLTCDLHGDGTEAVTTIRLDNGTVRYELDLCQTHLGELTGAGRRLRPRRRTGGAGSATKAANKTAAVKTRRRGGGALDTAAVREWALGHGFTSVIAVESRVGSWKPSPPASRRRPNPESTGRVGAIATSCGGESSHLSIEPVRCSTPVHSIRTSAVDRCGRHAW